MTVIGAPPIGVTLPRALPRAEPAGWTRTLGPALLVAAGYVDPGNWGTDVAAGARFGYRLVWVLALATAAALFLQHLAARLGLRSGHDLASLIRTRLPRRVGSAMIAPLLGALAVTEVVEVLGVVIGVQLLTGWSAGICVLTAAGLVSALLLAPGATARRAVYGCLAVVAVVYLSVLLVHGGAGAAGGMVPRAMPAGGLPVAVGLVGAVVMPHNILLHSALARDVHSETTAGEAMARRHRNAAKLQRTMLMTTAVALGVALLVNVAIMSVSVHTGAGTGNLAGTLRTASPLLGPATGMLFAVTLIGAGLASSATGGMASADVLRRLVPGVRMPDAVRRLACLVPATAVAMSGWSELSVLVWSQVILTLTLPLVLVPLIWFNCRRDVVGSATLRRPTRAAACVVTLVLCVAGVASLVAA